MRRSYLIAGGIALLAAGWLASGMLTRHEDGQVAPVPSSTEAQAAPLADEAPEVDAAKPGATVEPTGAP
ncbi:MAG TPA: hypothetical protein VG742_05380, partial [Dongiaceae bacterium]|nr:hypothetical protein [Dongiaceae bacterium]